MEIIDKNPYRYLGVYSNSPIKERVANRGKMNAFLSIGKSVSFPLDLPNILPAIDRSIDTVTKAESQLTLPADQIRYAQFWFVKVTLMDGIALNHLIGGNAGMALSIWEKKDNMSSLQNRMVYALIRCDYVKALNYAEKLYTDYVEKFAEVVQGTGCAIEAQQLVRGFLDELGATIGVDSLLSYLSNDIWMKYVQTKGVKPLMDALLTSIKESGASKGKGCAARLAAGIKLMSETKQPLDKLKALLSISDLQYQTIADKVGLAILQCGIDYFNDSEEVDAPQKAMRVQSYALSVVVGKMAKDRCQENVDILQKIIDELPPLEVQEDAQAVQAELRAFCKLPDKICHAVTLLENTKPYLQRIKERLGAGNDFYLKLSTKVVGNALHNVIEEVNSVQKDETVEFQGRQIPISMILNRDAKISQIKTTLREAWKAIQIMDVLDMEDEFKTNRYNLNRSILKDLCIRLGLSTSSAYSKSRQPYSPVSSHGPMRPSDSSKESSRSDNSDVFSSPWWHWLIAAGVFGIIALFLYIANI